MLSLFDTQSLERALALPLDIKLRNLLRDQIDHLNGLDFDVRATTYFLIIDPTCTVDDVIDELGWSPLVNPLDGVSFGNERWHPFHDHLEDCGGWFRLMVSAGNNAVHVLMIEDDEGVDARLLDLCRTYAN